MRGGAMRGGNVGKTTRSRVLRKVENDAENVMWHELRGAG
ncbi:hypothetical protein SAMN04488498_1504 [Mesorhizobium albiziae]|uniref:Uncharacterized protein n=1 Tax=Neomesorhizobium albiziae TaxID=335020 RepID=A0A1I4FLV4_9HYPH|nr:hypothetical protein SAMN04488498_1504 [Mesorhizobium albiziae]